MSEASYVYSKSSLVPNVFWTPLVTALETVLHPVLSTLVCGTTTIRDTVLKGHQATNDAKSMQKTTSGIVQGHLVW